MTFRNFKTALTVFAWFIALAGVSNQHAISQSREAKVPVCKVGVQAPGNGAWTWPANRRVNVFIVSSDFRPGDIPYLLAPLESWNAISETSGSRVSFAYAGTVTEAQTCEYCLTITREAVFDKKKRHAAEYEAASANDDRLITWAKISVDPRITDPRAVSNVVAHEVGHTFGLLDCFSCKDGSTIMNQLKVMNVSNGMEGPTACDVAQIKQTYAKSSTRVAAKPAKRPVDPGEEPEDDDTPIVIPNP